MPGPFDFPGDSACDSASVPVERRYPLFALGFTAVAATVLLLARLLLWNIVDRLTPFIGFPVMASAWGLGMTALLVGAVHGWRQRRHGRRAAVPLMIAVASLLLAAFLPFTSIWLSANFHWNKTPREQVVAEVRAGSLVPNVKHNPRLVALGGTWSYISKGGNEIVVQGKGADAYVFFFTYRGILDNYSGFLWVPDGLTPDAFSDAGEPGTQIVSHGGNWYFVGHR